MADPAPRHWNGQSATRGGIGTDERRRAMLNERMAIIDGGNLGSEIARGLVTMGVHAPGSITITRRSEPSLAAFKQEGFGTTTDNAATVWDAAVVLVAVRPKQMNDVLEGIAFSLRAYPRGVAGRRSGRFLP
jgi:hypothetical protein